MRFKAIICRWRGHDLRNSFIEWECDCCGQCLSYDDMVQESIKRRIARWLRARFDWFRKCPDCGRRFGRHHDDVDHVPF
jgi:uncharacterized protein with PIN domain